MTREQPSLPESSAGSMAGLPLDPDLEPRRPTKPKLQPDLVAAIFVGGCVGGALRYAATSLGSSGAGAFPWATFAVNVAGAFVLSVVVVVAAEVVRARYLRPLLGTGFCGALTTFSSVVVVADQMLAHHHVALAAVYLAATVVAGLAAAALGLLAARALARNPARARAGAVR